MQRAFVIAYWLKSQVLSSLGHSSALRRRIFSSFSFWRWKVYGQDVTFGTYRSVLGLYIVKSLQSR